MYQGGPVNASFRILPHPLQILNNYHPCKLMQNHESFQAAWLEGQEGSVLLTCKKKRRFGQLPAGRPIFTFTTLTGNPLSFAFKSVACPQDLVAPLRKGTKVILIKTSLSSHPQPTFFFPHLLACF